MWSPTIHICFRITYVGGFDHSSAKGMPSKSHSIPRLSKACLKRISRLVTKLQERQSLECMYLARTSIESNWEMSWRQSRLSEVAILTAM